MRISTWFVAGFATSVLLLSVTACNKDKKTATASVAATSASGSAAVAKPVERNMDFGEIARGGQIFEKNCAVCHGTRAQGAINWRFRGPDGKFPAPPLNGTGHAWHHPLVALQYVINNGSPGGQGNMPAWKGKLSNRDISEVIAWLQSKWPDQVYQVWAKNDQRSRARGQ